ncbi:MAG: 50S ribosomal protein L4 [Thermoprotei archaeon]
MNATQAETALDRKCSVYSLEGETAEQVNLPPVFATPVRGDLIRKVFHALFTGRLQPKGRDPLAGKRVSVESFGTGREMARLPRHSSGRAGFAPMARGGYKPHLQRTDTVIHERVNLKEKHLALASAIAATSDTLAVSRRGHRFDSEKVSALPVVVVDDVEKIDKTVDAVNLFSRLGLEPDLHRVLHSYKIRAGVGKVRGRKTRFARGPLVVVSSSCPAQKAFRNIPGVDVVPVSKLSVLDLAPGGVPGRLTVWSVSSIRALGGAGEQ